MDWPACKNLARVRKVVTESPERIPKSSAQLSKPTLPGQQGQAEPPKGEAPRSSGQDSLKRTGQTKPEISAMPLKPEWSPQRAERSSQKAKKPSIKKKASKIAKEILLAMLNPPSPVEKLPLLEHNGTEILPIVHHGFSRPQKGPQPAARTMYGARDANGERHWRGSLHEIQQLIDGGFAIVEQADA